MVEKEIAKELISRFYRFAKGQTNEARLINAKLSASYCVDEILESIFEKEVNEIEFYQKIKTEIENFEQ